MDEATVAAIRAVLVRHMVIFFREQAHLDDAKHEAFAARLGKPVAHPTVPVAKESKYALDLDSRNGYAASSWHTDVTFTFLIRGFNPLHDAIEYGREIIPRVRAEIARRDASERQGGTKTAKTG